MGLSTTLAASAREAGSSNKAKRLRASGRLPAVCYGEGSEARAIELSYNEVKKAFLGDPGNRSLFTLAVGDDSFPALVKALQIHPVSRRLLHVDFLKIDPGKKVTVKVPLTLAGKAQGVERGGQILQSEREIAVSGLPADIPSSIEADVTSLNLGQTLHLSQVALPETLSLVKTVDLPVAVVNIPKGLKAEAEAAQAADAAAQAAAPAKAAPAKAAKEKGGKGDKDKKK
ncbi:MAG: 50S ribosomal protein L25 [Deltaproteobacteria bacterium]|jgi:large subunit ribosomal protein L25|nr:50S ribosomal protein L25 [Deltaproteobacteria bacterium]